MYDIQRTKGKTIINDGRMQIVHANINRRRFNDLRKQVDAINTQIDQFHNLLVKALAQGKRK